MDRVIVKPYSKDRFEVAEDFNCYGYTIPEGFITNGADIPRVFWSLFPPNSPEYLSAVVLHDYMCKNVGKNRGTPRSGASGGSRECNSLSQRSAPLTCEVKYSYKEADEMFYIALIDIGVAKWKAWIFYKSCSIYHTIKSFLKEI